jgi:hypothetical protein
MFGIAARGFLRPGDDIREHFIRKGRQDCDLKFRAVLPAKQDGLLADGVPAPAFAALVVSDGRQRDASL